MIRPTPRRSRRWCVRRRRVNEIDEVLSLEVLGLQPSTRCHEGFVSRLSHQLRRRKEVDGVPKVFAQVRIGQRFNRHSSQPVATSSPNDRWRATRARTELSSIQSFWPHATTYRLALWCLMSRHRSRERFVSGIDNAAFEAVVGVVDPEVQCPASERPLHRNGGAVSHLKRVRAALY